MGTLSRIAVPVAVLSVAASWLLHAGFKVYAGVGEGTMYASWIGGHILLHWAWCACEVGLGLWLLSWRRVQSALLVSMFVLATFSGLILLEPQPKPCGCGWQQQAKDHAAVVQGMRWSVGRNAALLALAFLAVAVPARPRTPNADRAFGQEPSGTCGLS